MVSIVSWIVVILVNSRVFVLHKFENKLDTVTGQMNFHSLQLDKCKYG